MRWRVGRTHAWASAARVLWTVLCVCGDALVQERAAMRAPMRRVHARLCDLLWARTAGVTEEGGTAEVRVRPAGRVHMLVSHLFDYVSTRIQPDAGNTNRAVLHHAREEEVEAEDDDEDAEDDAAWPYRSEHHDSRGGRMCAGARADWRGRAHDVSRVLRLLRTRYDCSLMTLCLDGLWSVLRCVCGGAQSQHGHGTAAARCACRGLGGLDAQSWQAFTAHVRFLARMHAEVHRAGVVDAVVRTHMEHLFYVLLDVVLLSSSSSFSALISCPSAGPLRNSDAQSVVMVYLGQHARYALCDAGQSKSGGSGDGGETLWQPRSLVAPPLHLPHLHHRDECNDRVWAEVPRTSRRAGATTLDGLVAALMRYSQPDRYPRTRMAVLTALRHVLGALSEAGACGCGAPDRAREVVVDAEKDEGRRTGGVGCPYTCARAALLLVLLRLLCDDAHDIRQRACAVCSSAILRARGGAYGARDQMSCVLAVVLHLRAHARSGELTESAFADCFGDVLLGQTHAGRRKRAVPVNRTVATAADGGTCGAREDSEESSSSSSEDEDEDEDEDDDEDEDGALFTHESDNMFMEATMVRYWHSRIFDTVAASLSFPVLDDLLDEAVEHGRLEVVIEDQACDDVG